MCEKFLERFEFCPDYGFVIKDPLERLEAYFDPWTELVLHLDDIRYQVRFKGLICHLVVQRGP